MQPPASVRIGGRGKGELLEALLAQGVRLNPLGLALFRHPGFTTLDSSETVEIACVTVAGLGFPGGGRYEDLVLAARRRGLAECPPELGAWLRMAFLHQAEDPVGPAAAENQAPAGAITVASAPLDSDERTPRGFYLRCSEGRLWLRGYTSWQGHVWNAGDAFVFARQGHG